MNEDTRTALAKSKMKDVKAAANRIAVAVAENRPVDLEDAKVLEAAGCWVRRQLAA